MDLYNDSDAPSIDIGVQRRLKRLDPRLRVTFSKYAIDHITSFPVAIKNWDYDTVPEGHAKIHKRGGSCYLYDPSFHLWSLGGDSRWRYVMSYDLALGVFGHQHVSKLEGDVARRFTPTQILDRMEKAKAAAKEKAELDLKDQRRDTLGANESRIRDLLDGKHGTRQAKISSYSGQKSRSTPGDIVMDDREAGWEKLDRN